MTGKKTNINKTTVKYKSSISFPISEELKEDIEVINLRHNDNMTIRYQCDGGVNTSVMNSIKILHNVITLDSYPIGVI